MGSQLLSIQNVASLYDVLECRTITIDELKTVERSVMVTNAANKKHAKAIVKALMDEVALKNPLFEAEYIVPIGSAEEGTCIHDHDYDYNVVLSKFSNAFEVLRHDESGDKNKAFVRFRLPQNRNGSVYEMMSLRQYIDENELLNTRRVRQDFQALLFAASNYMDLTALFPDLKLSVHEKAMGKIATRLTVKITDAHSLSKVVTLKIDITPLIVNSTNIFATNCKSSCFFVLAEPPLVEYSQYCARISFVRQECEAIARSPPVVKAAIKAGKLLCTELTNPFSSFSYMLKNAALCCTDDEEKWEAIGDDFSSEDVNCIMKKIFNKVREFVTQNYVPTFFFPSLELPVWKHEPVARYSIEMLRKRKISIDDVLRQDKEILELDSELCSLRQAYIYSHQLLCKLNLGVSGD